MAIDVAQQLGAQLQANYLMKLVYRAGNELMLGSSNVFNIHAINGTSVEAEPKAVLKQQMGRGGQVSCRAAAGLAQQGGCGEGVVCSACSVTYNTT